MKRSVWYLAHPIKADETFTLQQNMDHVVHLTKLFFEEGIYVCAPYHTFVLALDDNNTKHRVMGTEADRLILSKLNQIILVGHTVSVGMYEELELVHSQGGAWENLVGFSNDKIRKYIDLYREDFL